MKTMEEAWKEVDKETLIKAIIYSSCETRGEIAGNVRSLL